MHLAKPHGSLRIRPFTARGQGRARVNGGQTFLSADRSLEPWSAKSAEATADSLAGISRAVESAESATVGVEGGLPAEVGVKDVRALRDLAAADQVDQGGHGLALVYGVEDHALESAGEPDRVEGGVDRDAVQVAGPSWPRSCAA